MTEPREMSSTPPEPASGDRLDSWKEIAAYMRRDAKTVQRWEKREGMPVHRHLHDKAGSVYAFRSELDAWAEQRRLTPADALPSALVSEPVRGTTDSQSDEELAGVDEPVMAMPQASRTPRPGG